MKVHDVTVLLCKFDATNSVKTEATNFLRRQICKSIVKSENQLYTQEITGYFITLLFPPPEK